MEWRFAEKSLGDGTLSKSDDNEQHVKTEQTRCGKTTSTSLMVAMRRPQSWEQAVAGYRHPGVMTGHSPPRIEHYARGLAWSRVTENAATSEHVLMPFLAPLSASSHVVGAK